MANTTSGTTIFDKNFAIDEIIEEAYERIGMQGVSGNQLRTARRSLNICLLYTSPSPRDLSTSRMPSSA